jgi:hypothetical protein
MDMDKGMTNPVNDPPTYGQVSNLPRVPAIHILSTYPQKISHISDDVNFLSESGCPGFSGLA